MLQFDRQCAKCVTMLSLLTRRICTGSFTPTPPTLSQSSGTRQSTLGRLTSASQPGKPKRAAEAQLSAWAAHHSVVEWCAGLDG